MRASQADSVASASTNHAPLQVPISQMDSSSACKPAKHSPIVLFCTLQSPDQELQQGKFYFKDGSTYEGQFKVLGLAAPAVDAAPAKKGIKKKEEELLTQPAEPPEPVRHGVGEELTALLFSSSLFLQLTPIYNQQCLQSIQLWDGGSKGARTAQQQQC